MAPGANIGEGAAIFEAVHGSAPDIAGKNIANPTSVILASIQMLEYLGMQDKAERIREAVRSTIESGDRVTWDLGLRLHQRIHPGHHRSSQNPVQPIDLKRELRLPSFHAGSPTSLVR